VLQLRPKRGDTRSIGCVSRFRPAERGVFGRRRRTRSFRRRLESFAFGVFASRAFATASSSYEDVPIVSVMAFLPVHLERWSPVRFSEFFLRRVSSLSLSPLPLLVISSKNASINSPKDRRSERGLKNSYGMYEDEG